MLLNSVSIAQVLFIVIWERTGVACLVKYSHKVAGNVGLLMVTA